MPVLRRSEDKHGRLRRRLDHRDRRLQGSRLDVAALAVVFVETACQIGGERRVVGCEQARSKIGCPDPAPCIDARTEDKAEMMGVERLVYPGHRSQRHQTRIGIASRNLDPLCDKGAVQSHKRDNVADGAEGYQIKPTHQVGLRTRSDIPAHPAQCAVDRNDQQKRYADRRQRPVWALLVEPVRVDYRRRAWQLRLSSVVIDDNDFEPNCSRISERQMRIRPTIYGDDDARALVAQTKQGRGVWAVALAQTVRYVDSRTSSNGRKKPRKQSR